MKDIEKMHNQVLIDEKDLFPWSFGDHLSDLSKEILPIGAEVIRNNFYVYDLLTGAAALESLVTIRGCHFLSSADFEPTNWLSNHADFNESGCSKNYYTWVQKLQEH